MTPGGTGRGLVGPRGEVLAAASAPRAGGAAPEPVIDVDARTFEAEVLRRSLEVPVVVDLWAPWCGPCKTLSPLLERIAREAAGRFVLAKVNVDEVPDVAAAFGARSIPTVVAMVGGRPVDAFVGARPEREIRRWLDRVAPAHGAAAASSLDPEDLLGAGRLDEARTEWARRLEADPSDIEAIFGLARAAVLAGRPAEAEGFLRGLPPDRSEVPRAESVRAAVALAREDSPAGRALAAGDAAAACDLLLDGVRSAKGEARAAARERLVALLDVMGRKAPAAEAARERLARLLF